MRKRRVLFLDSDEALVEVLPGLLGDGIEIVATTSADEVLRRLSSGRSDTVLLGSGISRMEKESLVKIVQKMKESAPQVILMALITAGDHKACSKVLQAGVESVTSCPSDISSIVRALKRALHLGTP